MIKFFFLKEVITVPVIVLLVERRSKIENFLKTKINVRPMTSKLEHHFLHWNQMNPNQHSFARGKLQEFHASQMEITYFVTMT